MQRWEYMTVRIGMAVPDRDVCALLNDYGNGGWELISAREERYWLKRMVESEDDARR